MADEKDAIQTDVSEVPKTTTGLETPAEKTEKKERQPSARELAMEYIGANRDKAFEDESGIKLTPDPAPAKVDPPKEDKKVDEATDVDKQVEKQTDKKIISANDLADSFVMTKVNGVEELVSATKVLAQYQKGAAVDVALAEARKVQKQANDALAEATAKLASAGTPAAVKEAKQDVQDAKESSASIKLALDAMFEGDSDKAASLLAAAISGAQNVHRSEGRGDATLNVDEIVSRTTDAVKQTLNVDRALDSLFTDYPEIASRRSLQLVADHYVVAHMANGMSKPEAITQAGADIAEEFGLKKTAAPAVDKGRPLNAEVKPRTDKQTRKDEIDDVTGTGARAVALEDVPQTQSEIIAEMASRRLGGKV